MSTDEGWIMRRFAELGLDTPEKVWARRRKWEMLDTVGLAFDLAIIAGVVVAVGMGWLTEPWWVFVAAFWVGERWSSLCHVLVRLWRLL